MTANATRAATAARLPTLLVLGACLLAPASIVGCVVDLSYGMAPVTVPPQKDGPASLYMGYAGGKGFLSFDDDLPTDASWVAPAASNVPNNVVSLAHQMGLVPRPQGVSAEFTLPPLTQERVLNASMEMMLHLWVSIPTASAGNPAFIAATASVDSRFMAQAAVTQSTTTVGKGGAFTEVVLPLVSEVANLAVGSRLTLRIDVLGATGDAAIGFQPGQHSHLNVSLLDPLRNDIYLDSYNGATIPLAQAEPAPSSATGTTSGASGADGASAPRPEPGAPAAPRGGVPLGMLLAAAPLLGLLAFVPRRPGGGRTLAVLAVALLVAAGVAGCSGQGGKRAVVDDGSTIDEYLDVPDDERRAILQETGTGDLNGRVFHDVGLPLQGAHISLLGTDLFRTADPAGRFQFLGLAPGTYKVRIDAQGFQSIERGDVLVRKGNVTRLDVTMVPVDDPRAGFLSHRHDEWGAKTSLLLYDGATPAPRDQLETSGYPMGPLSGTTFCLPTTGPRVNGEVQVCKLEFVPDLVGIVPPGTAQLAVTIGWDPNDNDIDLAGFMYTPANRNHPLVMSQKASGSTWTVPVSHAMTDRGHQAFSFWSFYVYVMGSGSTYVPAPVETVTAPFQVKVEALKGVVPYEPGHRDLWQGNTTIGLLDSVLKQHTSTYYSDLPRDEDTSRWLFDPPALVPPGTGRLEVRLEYGVPPGATGLDPFDDWTLAFHSAEVNPRGYSWDDLLYPEPKERGDGYVLYDLPLTTGMTDAYYQTKSNWVIFLDDGGTTGVIGNANPESFHYIVDFRVTATAHLDPAYAFAVR